MALRTNAQYTSSTQKTTKETATQVKNQIIEWMRTPGSNPNKSGTSLYEGEGDPKGIIEKYLREAIKIVTGKVDERTVNNWIKRLVVHHCIKNCGARWFEFLYDDYEESEQQPPPKQKEIDAAKEFEAIIKQYPKPET